jgi:hypothetical protein
MLAMIPSESASALRQFLAGRGIDAKTAMLDQIVEAALDFYVAAPASGLVLDGDADMLLFQFGICDWGNGEHFEFDITRQFIIAGAEDDDAISQLHCTMYYQPTVALRAIGRGNRWCASQADFPEFRKFVLATGAYAAVLPLPATERLIEWEPV